MKFQTAALVAATLSTSMANAEALQPDHQTLPEVAVKTNKIAESTTAPIKKYRASQARTATKTDLPINETSQSISVVSSEQMRDQAVQTLAESLRFVAGVDAGQRGRRGLDDFSIRGFVQSDYVLRDGMRMAYDLSWIQAEPFGLERVEVLKGPSSVLYGQTGPGGFVNLVSKRPTDTPMARFGMAFGNYQQQQYTADISDALNQDKTLRYRLVALTASSDDQVDFVDRKRQYVAPSLTWDISDNTSLTVLTSYQKSSYVPIRGLPADGTILPNINGDISFKRFVGVPGLDHYDTEQTLLGYEFSHAFNAHLSFRQNLRYNTLNLDGTFTEPSNQGLSANKQDYRRAISIRQLSAQMWTIDHQLAANFDLAGFKHQMLFGVDNIRYYLNRYYANRSVTPLNLYSPNYSAAVLGNVVTKADSTGMDELTQQGLYWQDLVKFGEGWNLQLGLRHDRSEINQNRITGINIQSNAHKTTGKLGLLYAFENGWSPYVSYSESFVPLVGSTFAGTPFVPETGQQKEAGLKYASPDQRFSTTFSVYELKRQNVTTNDPVNGASFSVQTGEQRHRGFEWEVTGQVTDDLNLVASYTYIDAEVTKSNSTNLGKRPILVANHMANAWLNYNLSAILPGLSVGAGVRHIGKQAGNETNTFDVPDYTLFDAGIYYTRDAWRFALNGKNLANKRYIAGCSSQSVCFTGDPQMLLLTANYEFK